MVEKINSKSNNKKSKNPVSKDKNIKKANKDLKKDMKKMNGGKKRKVGKIILITFLVLFLIGIIAAGVVIGMIFSKFSDDWKMDKEDLVMGDANSQLVDADGEFLAMLTGDETRQPVTLSEMSEYLPKAYVAMEDERFYDHAGIDVKRTLGAIIKYLMGDSSYGGSSITQQVVKNLTKDDEREIERKIKEWGRAYNVEQLLSKDEILQLYLNLIYVGGPTGQSLHGVEIAANYYFDKTAKELSLAECAFLAGINSSPSSYRPFDDLDDDGNMPEKMQQKIDNKTKTVLNKMLELGTEHKAGVSQEEYDAAVAELEDGLKFKKGQTRTSIFSFHTESAINEVIEDYMEEKDCTRDFAKNYIYSSGLTIYTTQDSSIQKAMEKEYEKKIEVLTSKQTKDDDGKYVKSQSAMVIIDHKTGYVVGSVGQIGKKKTNFGLNRAVDTIRPTGSSMKPLAVYAPCLEEGLITAASVYDDVPTTIGGNPVPNHDGGYDGLTTIREAIKVSQNPTPAKLILQLSTKTSMKYLKEFGITTINEKKDNSYSLALGGLTDGISVLEMAGAYATIANNGVYIEPTFYTEVKDSNGNVILETTQETHRVLSKGNAYVMQNLLTAPVTGGTGATAGICKVTGIDTAAKTGTTDNYKDRWLCGFTPYYTAAVWYGFDQPERIYSGYNYGSYVFSRVMNEIHEDLPNKKFSKPDNVVSVAVCKDSGLLPGEHCKDTVDGDCVYTEVFVKGTVPTKTCDVHVKAKVCPVEGKKNTYELANDACPDAVELTFITRENSDVDTDWQEADDAKFMLPTVVCERHKEAPDTEAPVISMNGAERVVLKVGENYTDAGATALDNKDGDLTANIVVTGVVNISVPGTYLITYTVEDAAKNVAVKTRTVVVETEVVTPPPADGNTGNAGNTGDTGNVGGNTGDNNNVNPEDNTSGGNTDGNNVDTNTTGNTVDTSGGAVTGPENTVDNVITNNITN